MIDDYGLMGYIRSIRHWAMDTQLSHPIEYTPDPTSAVEKERREWFNFVYTVIYLRLERVKGSRRRFNGFGSWALVIEIIHELTATDSEWFPIPATTTIQYSTIQ